MKALKIDYNFYQYPSEFPTIAEFITHINEHSDKFIPMVEYLDENCVEPYFIQSETEKKYINMSVVRTIQECDITVLTKQEYDRRLAFVIQEHCLDCVNYREDDFADNMLGHRDKISLDGKCAYKSTLEDSI